MRWMTRQHGDEIVKEEWKWQSSSPHLLASESVEAFNVLSLCWFNPTILHKICGNSIQKEWSLIVLAGLGVEPKSILSFYRYFLKEKNSTTSKAPNRIKTEISKGKKTKEKNVGKRKFCTGKIGSRPVTAFLLFLTIFAEIFRRNGSEIADLKSKKIYPFPFKSNAAFVTTLMPDWEKEKAKSQQKFEAQPLQNCRSRNTDLYFGEIRSYKSTKSRDQQMKEN